MHLHQSHLTNKQNLLILKHSRLSLLPSSLNHKPICLLDLKIKLNSYFLIGSCNGLLCMFQRGGKTLILLNPSTQKYEKISFKCRRWNATAFGFTYNKKGKDYEIVTFRSSSGGGSDLSVYSFRTKLWKEVKQNTPYAMDEEKINSSGVFIHDALHWIASKKGEDSKKLVIVGFDSEKERVEELRLPDVVMMKRDVSLTVYRGKLCVLNLKICCERVKVVDVWVMEGYGTEMGYWWVKVRSIQVAECMIESKFQTVETCMHSCNLVLHGVKEEELREMVMSNRIRDQTIFTCVDSLTGV